MPPSEPPARDAPLRVVFFGTPRFAVPSLRTLLAGPDRVVAAVCQPDRPAGRGRALTPPPVKAVAAAAGVPVLQPETLRDAAVLDSLRALAPDLIVVAAYGKLLPKALLDLPPRGCINVHASLLPRYRGAAPVQWAILRGETVTGVTIMRMNERMDAGDILLQRTTPIGPEETAGELEARLAEIGARALAEALAHLRAGTLEGRPQDDSEATLAPLLRKADGRIDWWQSAEQIARAVRAFNPWPSAFTTLDGHILKIHRARADSRPCPGPPGRVCSTAPVLRVATGTGSLVVEELQLEGRARMPADAFCRGRAIAEGTVLG